MVINKGIFRKFQNLYLLASENSPSLSPKLQHKFRRKSFLSPAKQRNTHSNCAKEKHNKSLDFSISPKTYLTHSCFPNCHSETLRLLLTQSFLDRADTQNLSSCHKTEKKKNPIFSLMGDGQKSFMKKIIKISQK